MCYTCMYVDIELAMTSRMTMISVLYTGEISGPDIAAVLVTALRLGVIDGSVRTHPGAV